MSACCRVKSTTSASSVQKGNIYLTYQRLSVYGYLNVIVCVLKGCVINVCLFSGYGHLVGLFFFLVKGVWTAEGSSCLCVNGVHSREADTLVLLSLLVRGLTTLMCFNCNGFKIREALF